MPPPSARGTRSAVSFHPFLAVSCAKPAALIASIRARNAASCTGVGAFAGNGQPMQPRMALSALSPTRISGWRQSGTGAGSGSISVMFASPALSTPSTQARSRARRT